MNEVSPEITTCIRLFEGMATVEIRRQKAEGSERQTPEDVEGLIEMHVNNDDIGEAVIRVSSVGIRLVLSPE